MDETAKLIMNYGFFGVIMIIVLYLGIKYIPKIIDNALEKSKKKDYREELYLEAIRNNTAAINNNSAVIKGYTDNAHKLEQKMDNFMIDFKQHDTRAEIMCADLKILKDRR